MRPEDLTMFFLAHRAKTLADGVSQKCFGGPVARILAFWGSVR